MVPPRMRTLAEFAEQEIVLPSGPHQGMRYRLDRQPYVRLFFDQVQSDRWRRIVVTGPSQSGKTLNGFVIPTLYHLFEVGETVTCGVPDLAMVGDKWEVDILPVIERTRYRELLPRVGEGARGGKVLSAVRFTNGATLRFMTGGGDDKSRAAFTSRVLVVTEVDGFDHRSKNSREADQIEQLEARTKAFGARARIYLESTVTVEEGRIWREYSDGTASRIAVRCPHCSAYATPEREHLVGWSGAETEVDARESARICCPECAAEWTEDERVDANRDCLLVHKGQEIDGSRVVGPDPRTETLGFRWNAANNLLVTAGDIAVEEWRGTRSPDPDSAERKLHQFVWTTPYKPEGLDSGEIDPVEVAKRTSGTPRGVVPRWCTHLTGGIDLGRHLCHWTVTGWSDDARGAVVDYGRIEVASSDMAEERALLIALREFRSICEAGWKREGAEETFAPELVLVDSGYMPDVPYAFVSERDRGWRAAKGVGDREYGRFGAGYHEPKTTGSVVVTIGDGYHVARLKAKGTFLVEINVSQWKAWVHERLRGQQGVAGSLELFEATPAEHTAYARHMAAERRIQEFKPRKGTVIRWEAVSKNNHWLDATTLAAVAGHAAGARLVTASAVPPPRTQRPGPPKVRVTGGWRRKP